MKIENKLVSGIVVGIAAGVIATAVKAILEKQLPVRDEDTPPPPEVLANKVSVSVTGEKVREEDKIG